MIWWSMILWSMMTMILTMILILIWIWLWSIMIWKYWNMISDANDMILLSHLGLLSLVRSTKESRLLHLRQTAAAPCFELQPPIIIARFSKITEWSNQSIAAWPQKHSLTMHHECSSSASVTIQVQFRVWILKSRL